MSEPFAAELVATIQSGCVLGEGPVWDERLGCLWFTDIQQSRLLRWDHGAGRLDRFDLPERLGSLGLTPDSGELLVALASGFALLRPESGAIRWLHRVEPAYRGVRLNDGRIDRQGRFWAGSMVENEQLAPAERGTLYRLDPPGETAPLAMRDGISISNSIAFSPDGESVYFADTPSQQILRYPCPRTGEPLQPGTVFASLSGEAFPDGSDVDAAGRLWNAEWGSGRVTAYNPDGSLAAQLSLPVSQPTCIAFGGPQLDLMFVTSASEGLTQAQLANEPHAGDVLVYRGRFRGLAAGRFGVKSLTRLLAAFVMSSALLVGALAPESAHAGQLALGAPFSDQAVLQRGKPLPVWGDAAPGAQVTVTLGGDERQTRADDDGHWQVEFAPRAQGEGLELVARSSGEEATARSLAIGDVFLCSGQSNMQFALAEAALRPEQRRSQADRMIRLLAIAQDTARVPLRAFRQAAAWQTAEGGKQDRFSAVCLLFGRQVAVAQKVPVGLIGSYWGGTGVESWMSRDGLARAGGMDAQVAALDAFGADEKAAQARFGADPAILQQPPAGSGARNGYANIYNAMIAPIGAYPLSGVLWYQGENNANRGDDTPAYKSKLEGLLSGWRAQLGENLPFVIVQLAAFGPVPKPPMDMSWAAVREAQRQVARDDPRAALVVTIDVGERLDIHPPLKLPVAQRAYQAARKAIYGEEVAPSGPEAIGVYRDRGAAVVRIRNAAGKLNALSWGRPGPFMACRGSGTGELCRFVDAEISGDTIRIALSARFGAERIRYCWAAAPLCNVFDDAQLPLGPFEMPIEAQRGRTEVGP